ncbi:MAG: hypothetical protein KDA44_08980 [Planctomycetales bacterium]|nr:hypothetical protein [Planctomycetales bacterium]
MLATKQNGLCGGLVALVCLFCGPAAQAQLLWSFETGLEGWQATGYNDSDFISIGTSASAATEGTQSLVVETGPSYGWDVLSNVGAGDAARYNAFNAVAANPDAYSLDFDVVFTPDSFGSTSSIGNYFLMNVAVNSDTTGFKQSLNVSPNIIDAVAGTPTYPLVYPISVPMALLPVSENSGFYQLNIGTNSDHVNGGGGEGVKYYLDNIRFTQLPQVVETTLFSWETPDNPATTEVNEQFEGWTPGFGTGHTHAITTVGATDGTYALEIDRSSQTSPNFTWGSQFQISSDTNPDPEIEDIDATLQATIDDLVGKINGATAVAFDVRIGDNFPYSAGYAKFGVHFTDSTGAFYDAEGASFNGPVEGDTGTVTIQLSNMIDNTSGMSLADAGLLVGTTYLRIGLSTNTDGPGLYQIDNFRVISEVSTDNADFNADGVVDGGDFLAWQRGYGTGTTLAEGDANGDGMVNDADLAIWQENFGTTAAAAAVGAVPEPQTIALAVLAATGLLGVRRRSRWPLNVAL